MEVPFSVSGTRDLTTGSFSTTSNVSVLVASSTTSGVVTNTTKQTINNMMTFGDVQTVTATPKTFSGGIVVSNKMTMDGNNVLQKLVLGKVSDNTLSASSCSLSISGVSGSALSFVAATGTSAGLVDATSFSTISDACTRTSPQTLSTGTKSFSNIVAMGDRSTLYTPKITSGTGSVVQSVVFDVTSTTPYETPTKLSNSSGSYVFMDSGGATLMYLTPTQLTLNSDMSISTNAISSVSGVISDTMASVTNGTFNNELSTYAYTRIGNVVRLAVHVVCTLVSNIIANTFTMTLPIVTTGNGTAVTTVTGMAAIPYLTESVLIGGNAFAVFIMPTDTNSSGTCIVDSFVTYNIA